MRAQFLRFYGHGLYYSPALWDTWDHIIPWGLFYGALRDMHAVMALERLNVAQAVAQANALTSGDGPAIRSAQQLFRKWVKEAYRFERSTVEGVPDGTD
jgi:hypothetical protein